MIAHVKDVEKPHNILMIIVEVSPNRITGFRPNMSDARPHIMAVTLWLRLNTALVIPVYP